jgi:hypothetical protein
VAEPRFNLTRLRGLTAARSEQRPRPVSGGISLSRRSFLGFSGSGIAYGAVSPLLGGNGFDVVREGSIVHVISGEQRRWSIDPAQFGAKARVAVEQAGHEIGIRLANAYFPGTRLPADFTCRFIQEYGTWMLRISMDCGIDLSASLMDWLSTKAPATGSWNIHQFSPFEELSFAFASRPSVEFTPDWKLAISAPSTVRLGGFQEPLATSAFDILLSSESTLAGVRPERSTTFLIPRGGHFWKIDISRQSDAGWAIDHDPTDSLFDEIQVEASYSEGRTQRSALLLQHENNKTVLQFQPGGTLCLDCAEPFALPLENPRLAIGLEAEAHRSLVADVSSKQIWAHGADASYLFEAAEEAPFFELHDGPAASGTPQVSPGICQVCFPHDSACVTLDLGKRKPVPFTWADLASPFERFAGWLHLLPSQHELVIDLEHGAKLQIDRPRDMLTLQFGFENMRLVTGVAPKIVHVHGAPDPLVKVYFPPQHVAETAYLHTDDPPPTPKHITEVEVPIGNVELQDAGGPLTPTALKKLKQAYDPDYCKPGVTPDALPAAIAFSGETQLVFKLPPQRHEIPFHIEALLDWDDWLPVVAPVAKSDAYTGDPTRVPPIVSPIDYGPYTAIELPYRLDLSPSELGRWAHSIGPVESDDKKIVELWHTRLGVLPSHKVKIEGPRRTIADETNSKDRVVRAIWSDDFQAVNPLKCDTTPPQAPPFCDHYSPPPPAGPGPCECHGQLVCPAAPFRMSLDARDRLELVHLTSNYGMTEQAQFCVNGPPPAKLLQNPSPVQVNRMILTPLGGYLDVIGQWNPAKVDFTHQLTVQLWKHHATLGRDHYVKVMYKGYLMPFGLRASLVKVTQRYFEKNSGSWVAVLHQHMYIVVKNERKPCPIMGQPYGGREFPFSYVEPVTLTTPFLNDPGTQLWPTDPTHTHFQSQSLFWPMLDPQTIFKFQVRFSDITGVHSAESSMPLVFVGSDVAQQDGSASSPNSQDAVRLYNGGKNMVVNGDDPYLAAKFNGQKFSFAKSVNPGDTDFETDTIVWRAVSLQATVAVTVGNAKKTTFLSFTETTTHKQFVFQLDASGACSAQVDSGVYTVTATTPGVTPAPTTQPFLLMGNTSYTLRLALNGPGNGFTTVPVMAQTGSTGPSPTDLYRYDLPFFYPAAEYVRITSSSIKRVTSDSTPTKFTFFPTYLTDGFDARTNSAEVVLQKSADDQLKLSFGGSGKVDQSGGLSSPDVLVVGFSRKNGVVGGKMDSSTPSQGRATLTSLSTFSSGVFNAADFFGGLLSAKLLGAVKLSDIIASLAPDLVSNLEKAPQMIEQALYAVGDAEQKVNAYIQPVVLKIQDFQKLAVNPIAGRVASQAQQLFSANAALLAALNAKPVDPIGAGVLEGQVIARIVDYATAVAGTLQDPASLAEDAILDAFTLAVQDFLNTSGIPDAITQQLNTLAGRLTQDLDDAIQAVAGALTTIGNKLANTPQVMDALTNAKQRLSTLAPEINNLVALKPTVLDLKNKVVALGQAMKAAANPLSLQPLGQIVGDLSGIVTDVQQIYQKAGFLGIVVNNATTASVIAHLNSAQTKLYGLWDSTVYAAISDDFQANCVKLASAYGTDNAKAQLILQNLRQLQKSVQQAANWKAFMPTSTDGTILYRRLQLLQKAQGHILQSLSAIQSLAVQLSGGAPQTVVDAANALNMAAPNLASSLTVVSQLLLASTNANSPEQLVADVLSDPILAKPLAASAANLRQQLDSLRAQIAASPGLVSLQVLYYKLCVDYQRAVGAAQSYLLYLKSLADSELTQALNALTAAVAPIETLAKQLQQSLCGLQNVWARFVTAIRNVPNPLSSTVPIGSIITSMFGDDLNAITTDFGSLCSAMTPSEFLADARQLATGFVTLESDIRSKAPAVLSNALTDTLKQTAQQLLDQLTLDQLPIPTSVNLSYTWNPTIQSFEPVFIVNDDATFTIQASAQAGLDLEASGPEVKAAVDISAQLTNFTIQLIGDDPFIMLDVDSLAFSSHDGSKPDVRLKLAGVRFGEAMSFVEDLAKALDPTEGPFIELGDSSILAGFRFAIASLTVGAFNLMQLAIEVAVSLSFDGSPVRCQFNLSDQQQPFLLSCGIFGGGGFLQLQLGLDGVQLLQGALEFGVCASISIGPLQGSGFVVAGIYFRIASNDSEVCGFVHAHGHMDIFGIISLDVDLYVAICYDNNPNRVTGTATFTVSVSIAFFSESFTLHAQYTFAGSSGSPQAQTLDQRRRALSGAQAAIALPLDEAGSGSPTAQPSCCPGPFKAPLFIDQQLWCQYYNSFA